VPSGTKVKVLGFGLRPPPGMTMLGMSGLHKGLEDQYGGDAVYFAFSRDAVFGVAGVVKYAMGLGAGETLVPKMDGQGKTRAKLFCKRGNLFRLRTRLS
jgi:hypothetical protein